MKLLLDRFIFTDERTISKLSVNGHFECFALEDVVRDPFVKVAGKTAIPPGTYGVTVNWSQRFNRMMPLLLDVPHFVGVRIHAGNTEKDTEGCLLVGLQITPERDRILASKIAFEILFQKISMAFDRGEKIELTIIPEHRPSKTEAA